MNNPGDVALAPERLKRPTRLSTTLMLPMLGLLLTLCWDLSRRGWWDSGGRVGYWLGVVGGSMMLLLLLYPLRKRVRSMRNWGSPKIWLWLHMLLGIGGPMLILLHCGFRAGSVNAAAALYSMCIVAGSGVLGRFLYVRINQGLVHEQRALATLRAQLGFDGSRKSLLWFAEAAQSSLLVFETQALARVGAGVNWLRLIAVLPLLSWRVRFQAQSMVRRELKAMAQAEHWSPAVLRSRSRAARLAVVSYLAAVMRLALFSAWERLFALWHVAHIPFVALLLGAGVVHVWAVHAY